ncbi:MAG: yqaB [Clostridia bacterium]|jgi:HAD superfamily hydrolase (TIGR01509 family)|nr:yqaB [Clostridia bacterium]
MLKGIIFDMDGVLVNSEPMHYKAYCLVLEEYGITYPYEIYKRFIGTTHAKVMEDIRSRNNLPCTDEEFFKNFKQKRELLIETNGFEGIKGVSKLISALHKKGYKLAVASSSPYEYIIRVTKSLGIHTYFDKIVSAVNVSNPKPAPDVFIKAAEELGLDPRECIAIEDSANGVKSAKAAGIPCIGFYNADSGDQDLKEAVIVVKQFEKVTAGHIEGIYEDYLKSS